MQTLQRYRPYIITSLVWVIILGVYVMYDRWPRPEAIIIESPAATAVPTPQDIIVHITGAVVKPGVYKLAPGARVMQAVDAAGGLLAEAYSDTLNFAAPVSDGQMIYITRLGETPPPAALPQLPAAGSTANNGLVNINKATASQLESLPCIGPTLAERIITYRDTVGLFKSIEEIDLVKGIGAACIEKIRDLITLE